MNKGKKLIVIILAISLLTGCSKFSPKESAVQIGKDGEITAAVIDKLDQNYYNSEELKTEVQKAVEKYNRTAGEGKVTIDEFQIQDTGEVSLFMKYAQDEDYAAFNHIDFYVGDITNGYKEAGYRFETTFQQIEKGNVIKKELTREDIFKGVNHPMLVFSEEMAVEVPGNILYVSSNVEVTGKKSARMFSEKSQETEETTTETTEDTTKGTEILTIEPEEVTADIESDQDPTLAYIIYE